MSAAECPFHFPCRNLIGNWSQRQMINNCRKFKETLVYMFSLPNINSIENNVPIMLWKLKFPNSNKKDKYFIPLHWLCHPLLSHQREFPLVCRCVFQFTASLKIFDFGELNEIKACFVFVSGCYSSFPENNSIDIEFNWLPSSHPL